ncbi:hypothetical protein SLS63_007210 [Diaporthe eres]|uniref:Piwi domain-containing protein n=1 Tax=Diaporthe eres TaxID=83184 RepID=A0ABR1P6J3_DIAER
MNVARGAGGPKTGPSSQGMPSRTAAAGQNLTAAKGEGLPVRPESASNPNPIRLLANYFNLKLSEDALTVYKYTIKILGSKNQQLRGATAREICKTALTNLKVQDGRYATDFQHEIVTLDALEIPGSKEDNKTGRLDLDGSAIEFESDSKLQLGDSASSSPSPDVIDCLNLVIGQRAREKVEIATIGRHRFFLESNDLFGRRPNKKGKLELHRGERFETHNPESLSVVQGFFHSVRPAEDKFFLNANSTFAVFRPVGNIGDICDRLREGGGQIDQADLAKLHRAISKARVSYELPKDSKNPRPAMMVRIAGFARISDKDSRNNDPARSLEIDNDFPGSKKAKFWFNNERRTVWYHFKKDWTKLVHERKNLNLDPDANQVLSNFGVSVDKRLLEVTGRILPTPDIVYSGQKRAKVVDASWNVARMPLVRGVTKQWSWIHFGGDNENDEHPDTIAGVTKLHDHLKTMCGGFPAPTVLKKHNISRGQGIDHLRKFFAWAKTNNLFVVVVCPNKLPADLYNALKFLGDIRFGLHTSCVLESKFRKKKGEEPRPLDDSYFANVALKINLKLGGINHTLRPPLGLSKESTASMVVGYDVTHPTEDEEREAEDGGAEGEDVEDGGAEESGNSESGVKGLDQGPEQTLDQDKILEDKVKEKSQVGLVISADDQLGQWLSYYWNQKPRQEMTDTTLTEAFVTLLQDWKLANGTNSKKPSLDVVIYRDGVSESQFDQVLQKEVPKIREAYKRVFPGKGLRITLVVAIKRHTTRFFPTDLRGRDSKGNIRPGTVVDNGVTQKKYWEFFMAAHSAIQGTAKPTRYVVVLDEIFLTDYRNHPQNSAARLESLTHDISYLFGRATKAVSVCTPAYYADILCTRARAYMSALANPNTRSMIEQSIEEAIPKLPDHAKEHILDGRIHPQLQRSMYWI